MPTNILFINLLYFFLHKSSTYTKTWEALLVNFVSPPLRVLVEKALYYKRQYLYVFFIPSFLNHVCISTFKTWKKKVKLIIFSQITASEESSRKKGFFCKSQFLLFEKILKAILFYGNKANVTSSCVKGFSREFENYCNKCVSSNILEKKK